MSETPPSPASRRPSRTSGRAGWSSSCDDEDRENEGDLTLAAQFATPENINFMAREARGLICLALTPDRCDELGLDLMAAKNESAFETAFTVSVEAREGVTTGHLGPRPCPHDPGRDRPAHRAPPTSCSPATCSRSRRGPGGVLERTGQTEAGVDLARLAGLIPAAVICEIMRDDGADGADQGPDSLLRAPRPEDDHRRRPGQVPAAHREARRARRGGRPATEYGEFNVVGYRALIDDKHHVALVKGDVAAAAERGRP